MQDSYFSILKALEHTAPYYGCSVDIDFIENTNISFVDDIKGCLGNAHGLIVPGGFGKRGVKGKIESIRYARENNLPFLGLCYGFQLAVIEFARNVYGMKNANSTEIDPKTSDPVIFILPDQKNIENMGGTMRLGGYDMLIKQGSLANRLYGATKARERHRS